MNKLTSKERREAAKAKRLEKKRIRLEKKRKRQAQRRGDPPTWPNAGSYKPK